MSKNGIIAIGYNRVESMNRLLTKLNECDYQNRKDILLIISIDNSGSDDIEKVARKFEWKFGKKIIKTYPIRLGLRKHILKCGNYLNEYDLDAMAVFEDDIYPSLDFYNYMNQAVKYYKNSESIAGISLYSHAWNSDANCPFQPIYNKYDTYFIKYAQSWGQVWMKNQWNDFIEWYNLNAEKPLDKKKIPENITGWPESSWLKYHIAYCIEKNKYFVYPYKSLSTCFTEIGEHYKKQTSLFQVPIQSESNRQYNFSVFDEDSIKYDMFFESEFVNKYLVEYHNNLCVDIYGRKENKEGKRFWMTTKKKDFYVVKSYGLKMYPHEANIIYDIPGKEIFIYDTEKKINNKIAKNLEVDKFIYYNRVQGKYLLMLKTVIVKIINKILKR